MGGLLHPNQCGSLPGLSTSDAVATLTHEVRTLQRPLLKVSTLFLDIKAGFDNVNATRLRALLLSKNIPFYMVDWVSSFLTGRRCTLVFQGAPAISAPVPVGTPQGSPLSPLLFLIYVAPLHFHIPTGIMVSYVDDFSLTVASPSLRSNIQRLQSFFLVVSHKASALDVSFSVAKTELIHWRTHSERSPRALPHHPRRPGLSPVGGGEMARLLAVACPEHLPPLQPPPGLSQRVLLLCETPLLPRRRDRPLPGPPGRHGPVSPHPHLRSRPPGP